MSPCRLLPRVVTHPRTFCLSASGRIRSPSSSHRRALRAADRCALHPCHPLDLLLRSLLVSTVHLMRSWSVHHPGHLPQSSPAGQQLYVHYIYDSAGWYERAPNDQLHHHIRLSKQRRCYIYYVLQIDRMNRDPWLADAYRQHGDLETVLLSWLCSVLMHANMDRPVEKQRDSAPGCC